MKVIIEKDENGLLWFKLNKPNKRNAIDFDVMFELEKALFMAKHDSSIKGMVIASEQNGMFCSGGDLDIFHGLVTETEAFEMLSHMGKLLVELMFTPVPTIALIDGAAVGGGCEISLACDFRIGTEQASFRFAQGKLGIITGWGGTTFASEKLPTQDALFMMLTGKKIEVQQALSTSLLHVKGECEGLTDWIHRMTSLSPAVIRAYKETILCKYKREEIEKRVLDECRRCAKLWESDEHHAAVRNFLQK